MASQATILHMPSVITTASSPESDEWSTYNLDWLYDPDRFDHLPIDKQLLLYKQRNLRKAKTFKLASTIWGTTYQRKRRFILDSGNTPSIINSFSTKVESEITNFENLQTDTVPSSIVDETDESKYSKWIENRKNLRHGLENLVVNEQWLSSKHGRTPMEQRVLEYLRQTRKLKENKQETTQPEVNLQGILPLKPILIRRPSPEALRILEKYLREHQIRLIDLFRNTDKNKDGKISKDDFRNIIIQAEIPLPDGLLDDLVVSLKYDTDGRIEFKELVKSMEFWFAEKKDTKRKILAKDAEEPELNPELEGFEFPDSLSSDSAPSVLKRSDVKTSNCKTIEGTTHKLSYSRGNTLEPVSEETQGAEQINDKTSLRSLKSLSLPKHDTRFEQLILSSEEAMLDLRKRDKAALASFKKQGKKSNSSIKSAEKNHGPTAENNSMVSTGDSTVDSHMAPSTLGSTIGSKMDNFRQERYREYLAVCRLCKEKGVVLNETFLKKALLFPADKTHKHIISSLKQKSLSTSLLQTDSLLNSDIVHLRYNNDDDDDIDSSSRSSYKTRTIQSNFSQNNSSPIHEKVTSQRTKLKSPTVSISPGLPQLLRPHSSNDIHPFEEESARDTSYNITHLDTYQQNKQLERIDSASYRKPRPGDIGLDAYIKGALVANSSSKMNLPTGQAVIKRQVDCWMTFEEYKNLIRPLSRKYKTLTTKSNPHACWPGYMLDKVRLYLDKSEPGVNSIFLSTKPAAKRSNPTYNNNIRTWPVSSDGYVQYGSIDPYKNKYI